MRGSKPGERRGGRQKGTRNMASVARETAIGAAGDTPLDIMLAVMRSPDVDIRTRLDAAKAAAPFVHPRLAVIQHTGKDGGLIGAKGVSDYNDLEVARRVAFVLAKGMKAKDSAPH